MVICIRVEDSEWVPEFALIDDDKEVISLEPGDYAGWQGKVYRVLEVSYLICSEDWPVAWFTLGTHG